jgi:hypothetical protein
MGHDWRKRKSGDWRCENCCVITAMFIDPPPDDQKFTPASLEYITAKNAAREMGSDWTEYNCEELQIWKVQVT